MTSDNFWKSKMKLISEGWLSLPHDIQFLPANILQHSVENGNWKHKYALLYYTGSIMPYK